MANEAHVRIDEGIERGSRIPPAPWPQRRPPRAGKLKDLDIRTVVARYLNGEEIAEIADTLDVHPKALNYHLLKPEVVEEWRAAQVAVSLAENQEAKQVVRDAPDALSLARAREQLRSSQWDLERLFSRLFGQKQELTITDNTDLGERLRRARERVIDSTATVVAQIVQDAPQQQPVIDVVPEQQITTTE